MEERMKKLFQLILIILFAALAIGALLPSCQDDDDDDGGDYKCAGGDYELVLDVTVDMGNGDQLDFQYRLIEKDDDFLYGKVVDMDSENIFGVLGNTHGEDSYIVTFAPGKLFHGFECEKPLSLTLDIKDLKGQMIVYCELEKLYVAPAVAKVVCDDTGVSI